MMATDVSAPEITARIGGREVTMRFDHNQMRMSEIYYQQTTLRKLGYLGIVDQMISRTYIGLGAIAYGAAASAAMALGKTPIAAGEFDRTASYDELRACAQTMIDAVIESMPKGEAKNA